MTIFISGGAGSGKTLLARYLVDHGLVRPQDAWVSYGKHRAFCVSEPAHLRAAPIGIDVHITAEGGTARVVTAKLASDAERCQVLLDRFAGLNLGIGATAPEPEAPKKLRWVVECVSVEQRAELSDYFSDGWEPFAVTAPSPGVHFIWLRRLEAP